MMTLVWIIVLSIASTLHAAEYYVKVTGNNSNSCTAAQNPATPKLTLAAGVSCLSSGDTLIIGAGTYLNQGITNPPSGTAGNLTTIKGDPVGARPIIAPDADAAQRSFYCIMPNSCQYIEVSYLEMSGGYEYIKMDGSDTLGYPSRVTIKNNKMHGSKFSGIVINSSNAGFVGGDHLVQGNEFYETGILFPNYEPGTNVIYNPGNRTVVENNIFHDNSNGVGIWRSNSQGVKLIHNIIIRNNLFYRMGRTDLNPWAAGATGYNSVHISVPGGGHQIYNNVIRDSCSASNCRGISMNMNGSTANKAASATVTVRNNTIYNFVHPSAYAVRFVTPEGGPHVIQNTIAIGTNGFNYQPNTSEVDNLTTGTATNLWTNPAAGDLTLKAGSAAINGGTNIGHAFCGSNPDQGAFESPVITAASINGNTLDVTICNTAPPIQPIGTWTPACTGTGCGTPIADSVSVMGGGLVRITVGGISGGACAAGQTWTISSSGANTDSASIGNQFNQPLHPVTNFPVNSSACTGSGGSGVPAGDTAQYNFENNLNDSSGNANHAVGSANIAYAPAHDMLGVQFANGVESYVDTGLLSGYNPSTNHLVVAFGIRIAPGDLGVRRQIAGVGLGTNQRFYIRRDSTNVWNLFTQSSQSSSTEFPVASGDTHVCVKFNPTTDTATLYINGQAGTIAGASVQSYTSYTFPSTFRFGLPSSEFDIIQSPPDIIDQAYIYTTDVSCPSIYAAWNPPPAVTAAVQSAHQWQGVFLLNSAPEDRGAVSAQRTIVQGGAAALQVQIDNTSGGAISLQPRFRYNVNGGAFASVVPDSPTADGISYWGTGTPSGLNTGISDGPIAGALTHTDGVTLTTSAAIPTIDLADNTSYTMTGLFRVDAAPGTVVCFKLYDQSGEPLAGYTPTDGGCLTVLSKQAAGGF